MRATPLPPRLAGRPFRTARALKLDVTRGRLGARDLAAPFRGVRAPAGADALIDLCRAYAQRMLAAIDAIDAAIERFGSRRGAIRLRAARADLRPGSASRRESRLRLRVLRAGFPEPELNTPIALDADRTTHGDLERALRARGWQGTRTA